MLEEGYSSYVFIMELNDRLNLWSEWWISGNLCFKKLRLKYTYIIIQQSKVEAWSIEGVMETSESLQEVFWLELQRKIDNYKSSGMIENCQESFF